VSPNAGVQAEQRTPRMLPAVRVAGVEYFVDIRLRQLRQVDNPHNFIGFEPDGGWAVGLKFQGEAVRGGEGAAVRR